MIIDYLPVAILLVLAAGLAGTFIGLSHLLGPKNPTFTKLDVYECGVEPVTRERQRFSVKFYLVAMLFILFDIETVFLIPWAVIYRGTVLSPGGGYIFWEMATFMAILAVGLAYVWRKGALEWD